MSVPTRPQVGAPAYHLTARVLEMPFVFDKTALGTWATFTRATPEAAALAAKVNASWAAFARTGRSNTGDLPKRGPCAARSARRCSSTTKSALVGDPRREEREQHARARRNAGEATFARARIWA
jgi:carboxylesterase type B